jgi:hypothetical protein
MCPDTSCSRETGLHVDIENLATYDAGSAFVAMEDSGMPGPGIYRPVRSAALGGMFNGVSRAGSVVLEII